MGVLIHTLKTTERSAYSAYLSRPGIFLLPGHSPGGTCYYTGNILFSGDVLFYRTCGRTDTQYGSREDQIKSLRKLYELFPDSTRVYPGHGQLTDIGSEKKENSRVTVDGGEWITK